MSGDESPAKGYANFRDLGGHSTPTRPRQAARGVPQRHVVARRRRRGRASRRAPRHSHDHRPAPRERDPGHATVVPRSRGRVGAPRAPGRSRAAELAAARGVGDARRAVRVHPRHRRVTVRRRAAPHRRGRSPTSGVPVHGRQGPHRVAGGTAAGAPGRERGDDRRRLRAELRCDPGHARAPRRGRVRVRPRGGPSVPHRRRRDDGVRARQDRRAVRIDRAVRARGTGSSRTRSRRCAPRWWNRASSTSWPRRRSRRSTTSGTRSRPARSTPSCSRSSTCTVASRASASTPSTSSTRSRRTERKPATTCSRSTST